MFLILININITSGKLERVAGDLEDDDFLPMSTD